MCHPLDVYRLLYLLFLCSVYLSISVCWLCWVACELELRAYFVVWPLVCLVANTDCGCGCFSRRCVGCRVSHLSTSSRIEPPLSLLVSTCRNDNIADLQQTYGWANGKKEDSTCTCAASGGLSFFVIHTVWFWITLGVLGVVCARVFAASGVCVCRGDYCVLYPFCRVLATAATCPHLSVHVVLLFTSNITIFGAHVTDTSPYSVECVRGALSDWAAIYL